MQTGRFSVKPLGKQERREHVEIEISSSKLVSGEGEAE